MEYEFIKLTSQALDITSKKFGYLTAIGPVEKTENRQIIWLCKCDCGNLLTVPVRCLRSKNTQSCGCLATEIRTSLKTTHGLAYSPLYKVWSGIVQRCTNPKNSAYKNYGGRGIAVYETWITSFEEFFNYVSELPHYQENGYSLDRIDNSLGYYPDNIRFVTKTEQNRNTRKNRLITYQNETKCMAEWSKITKIHINTLVARLKRGWSVQKTLATPAQIQYKPSRKKPP